MFSNGKHFVSLSKLNKNIKMDIQQIPPIVMIPFEDLKLIRETQKHILEKLANLQHGESSKSPYITSIEFMDAVRIRRSKFDNLVATNKIETLKKGRKIYVKATEIERYFNDQTIK